jgi:hypothetical protein
MFLGYISQVFCIYVFGTGNFFPMLNFCTFTLALSEVGVKCPIWTFSIDS